MTEEEIDQLVKDLRQCEQGLPRKHVGSSYYSLFEVDYLKVGILLANAGQTIDSLRRQLREQAKQHRRQVASIAQRNKKSRYGSRRRQTRPLRAT